MRNLSRAQVITLHTNAYRVLCSTSGIVQNPMSLRTLKFVARDPFVSKEQHHAATSAFAYEGYDILWREIAPKIQTALPFVAAHWVARRARSLYIQGNAIGGMTVCG